MSYLELAKSVKVEPGRTLKHPWRGRLVDCPKGRGVFGWTDGFRCTVEEKPNLSWLVDLNTVRLVEAAG